MQIALGSAYRSVQLCVVPRGVTLPTTTSPPPSITSQGVTIQPQEVAQGYAHEEGVEQERNAKLVFNPFKQYTNTVVQVPAVHPVSHRSISLRTYTVQYSTATRYNRVHYYSTVHQDGDIGTVQQTPQSLIQTQNLKINT